MAGDVHHGRSGAVSTVRAEGAVAATPLHSHLSLILGLVDAGTRQIILPDGLRQIEAGDGFVIPPDVAHAFVASIDGAHRILAIQPDAEAFPSWQAVVFRDDAWSAAFNALHRAAEAGRQDTLDLRRALIAETDRLAPRASPAPPAPRPVRAARRLAGERLDEAIDLRGLARQASLSPFYLHRLYRRTYGLTPAEHRLEARLRLARRLILAGVAIAEAAVASGFADQSHLNRAFRKLMGTSPGRWAHPTKPR